MPETGAQYILINKNFRSDTLQTVEGITVIDLALALTTLAIGVPAIIAAATLGSKLRDRVRGYHILHWANGALEAKRNRVRLSQVEIAPILRTDQNHSE